MKKLLITLLSISSLSAYAMNMDMMDLSYSAELNAGAKVLNIVGSSSKLSYPVAVSASVGASLEVMRNQMVSVNLGIGVLGDAKDLASKKALDAVIASLGVEYSVMVFEMDGVEVSVAPSLTVLVNKDVDLGVEGSVAVSLMKNVMDNLFVQLEVALLAGQKLKGNNPGLAGLALNAQPSVGVKWMF